MATQTHKRRLHSNQRGQRGGASAFVFPVIILLGAFVCLIGTFQLVGQENSAAQQLQAAPLCTPNDAAADADADCRDVAQMVVTAKWTDTTARGMPTYKLVLQSDTGGSYTVQLDNGFYHSPVWASVSVGQTVSTDIWQGQVVTVSAEGATDSTLDYPGVIPGRLDVSSKVLCLCISIGLFIYGAFLIVAAIVRPSKGL